MMVCLQVIDEQDVCLIAAPSCLTHYTYGATFVKLYQIKVCNLFCLGLYFLPFEAISISMMMHKRWFKCCI